MSLIVQTFFSDLGFHTKKCGTKCGKKCGKECGKKFKKRFKHFRSDLCCSTNHPIIYGIMHWADGNHFRFQSSPQAKFIINHAYQKTFSLYKNGISTSRQCANPSFSCQYSSQPIQFNLTATQTFHTLFNTFSKVLKMC